MNKSSTLLALSSILGVLLVASIAINNLEEAPLRKPFFASGKSEQNPSSEFSKIAENNNLKIEDVLAELNPSLNPNNEANLAISDGLTDETDELALENLISFNQNDLKYLQGNFGDVKIPENLMEKELIQNTDNNQQAQESLTKFTYLNNELLRKAGYSNFILQQRPFESRIFGEFDFDNFSSLTVDFYQVKEISGQKELLKFYQFGTNSKQMADETYNLLKDRFKNELGASLNETNSFGNASFYINFIEPKESVFLVVKFKERVYALAYPREKWNIHEDEKHFQLTTNLLKELLQ